ncbi:hypothetical protein [Chryseobacterium sp. Hurlbut01]|jgi:hypothetical protein|uniref:hypothetical protein n=1 Tax=Chryseobacterium sp. Hurlbut01 TaxID=1681828 RepID=UPI00067E24BB|nr:hypothetical protein [Chryseobacterium sp. Hurlbut01]KNB61888.1 hypothetical protein AC804_07520 [Chryseobacterium sp. Hurlbut01]
MNPTIIICIYHYEDKNHINDILLSIPNLKVRWDDYEFLSSNFEEYIKPLASLKKFINFGILCDNNDKGISRELLEKFLGNNSKTPMLLRFINKLVIIQKFCILIYDDWDDLIFEEEFIEYTSLYDRLNTPYCGMRINKYIDTGMYSPVLSNPILINVGFKERYGIIDSLK